jgi:hypothetical protein
LATSRIRRSFLANATKPNRFEPGEPASPQLLMPDIPLRHHQPAYRFSKDALHASDLEHTCNGRTGRAGHCRRSIAPRRKSDLETAANTTVVRQINAQRWRQPTA